MSGLSTHVLSDVWLGAGYFIYLGYCAADDYRYSWSGSPVMPLRLNEHRRVSGATIFDLSEESLRRPQCGQLREAAVCDEAGSTSRDKAKTDGDDVCATGQPCA